MLITHVWIGRWLNRTRLHHAWRPTIRCLLLRETRWWILSRLLLALIVTLMLRCLVEGVRAILLRLMLLLTLLVIRLGLLSSSSLGLPMRAEVISFLLEAGVLASLELLEVALDALTSVLSVITHVGLLEVTLVIILILISVIVIMPSMVVLITELIAMTHPTVDL